MLPPERRSSTRTSEPSGAVTVGSAGRGVVENPVIEGNPVVSADPTVARLFRITWPPRVRQSTDVRGALW